MHYLVLLYGDEATAAEPGTPAFDDEMAGYAAFDELAAEALRGGAALELSTTTRTIRHDGGAVTVTDGPFAETAEALGGYYVLEADDLDAVIDLVRHIPATADAGGGSEVRPLVMTEVHREEAEALPDLWLATLHRPEDEAEQPGSPGWDDGAAAHGRFIEAHRDRLVRSAAVQPTTVATTVRVRDGEVQVADGPYPGATPVVGGLYVFQGGADDALALAREIPMGDDGVVELRPVLDLSALD